MFPPPFSQHSWADNRGRSLAESGHSAITLSSVINRQKSNIGQSWSIIDSSGYLLQPKNEIPEYSSGGFLCLWSGKMCKAEVVITKFHRVLLRNFFVYARGRNTSIWYVGYNPAPEIMEMMKAFCDVCLAKNANFSRARNKDLPLKTIYRVGKERFLFHVEGACSVRNNQDEFLLKIFGFTIGLQL